MALDDLNATGAVSLTDTQLADLLGKRMSIYGSSDGPDRLTLSIRRAGLTIWASWEGVSAGEPPIFEGASTVRMARHVYSIPDPDQLQLTLFDAPG
jgi:hypothetical protein